MNDITLFTIIFLVLISHEELTAQISTEVQGTVKLLETTPIQDEVGSIIYKAGDILGYDGFNWSSLTERNIEPMDSIQSNIPSGNKVQIENNLALVNVGSTPYVTCWKFENGSWIEIDTLEVDPQYQSMGTHSFGRKMDLRGNLVIVGEENYTDSQNRSAGIAHIFRYENEVWNLESTLFNPFADTIIRFGSSVAIDGNLAVVGSQTEDELFCYQYDGTSWNFVQKIISPIYQGHFSFAKDIAISDSYLVACHPEGFLLNQGDSSNVGRAYIYKWNNSQWEYTQSVRPSDQENFHRFGAKVDIHKDVFVVSTSVESSIPESKPGKVYIFRLNQGTWEEEARIVSSDSYNRDQFGGDFGIHDDYLIVAARDYYFVQGDSVVLGKQYVFHKDKYNWTEVEKSDQGFACDTDGIHRIVTSLYGIGPIWKP